MSDKITLKLLNNGITDYVYELRSCYSYDSEDMDNIGVLLSDILSILSMNGRCYLGNNIKKIRNFIDEDNKTIRVGIKENA